MDAEQTLTMNLRKFTWYQLPAILWIMAIFIESSIPDISVPSLGFSAQDKVYHLLLYLPLGFLLIRAFYFAKNHFIQRHAILMAILVGILYGISDEIHQYFVPGRTCDIFDACADVVGILTAAAIYHYVILKKQKI
jgi:glycopeptide antibiotics resistance protein